MPRIRVHTNAHRKLAMNNRAIRLITFDLDHTLWNPDDALVRAEAASYQFLCEQLPAFAQIFSAQGFFDLRVQAREHYPALRFRVSELRRVTTRDALLQAGATAQRADELSNQAFDIFWALRQQVAIFDEAPALLQTLIQHFTLGAISNGNASLRAIGLDHFFAFHFAADDFPQGKPAPDMFLAALARENLAPQQVLHIGDHPVDDIQGAQAVGMQTLWVNLDRKTWPEQVRQPDFIVTDLQQIVPLLLP